MIKINYRKSSESQLVPCTGKNGNGYFKFADVMVKVFVYSIHVEQLSLCHTILAVLGRFHFQVHCIHFNEIQKTTKIVQKNGLVMR